MRFLTLIGLLLFPLNFIQAQSSNVFHLFESDLSKAERLFGDDYYEEAIATYERHLIRRSGDNAARLRIAEAYWNLNDMESAESWFERIIYDSSVVRPIHYYQYAECLASNRKYGDARNWYLKYSASVPGDRRPQRKIYGIDRKETLFYQDSAFYELYHFDFNSIETDFGAVFYRDGLVYMSGREKALIIDYDFKRQDQRLYELFYVEADRNGFYTAPERFEKVLNSNYHDGPVSFNNSQDRIFFTRNNYQGKFSLRSNRTHFKLDIFSADLVDGSWKNIMGFNQNSNQYSLGHPALSENDDSLFFASDKPGGFGGTDIYVSTKEAGEWSESVNLGPRINTEGDEMFPFVHGETLYFSSNGYAGLGGLDIYQMVFSGDSLASVRNLGYPINSSRDDFYFTLAQDGTRGTFSSNREGGYGKDDIYGFNLNFDLPLVAEGLLLNKNTGGHLADVKVTLSNLLTRTDTVIFTDSSGVYQFEVLPDMFYRIRAEKESFFARNLEFGTLNLSQRSIFNYIILEEFKPHTPIRIDSVFYDFDNYEIRADAAVQLDKIVKILLDNPRIKIELTSHTDSRGKDDYNLELSQLRAQSAVEYIIKHGIDSSRIEPRGFGETRLLNKCFDGRDCSDEEHQLNRRTEIEVIQF